MPTGVYKRTKPAWNKGKKGYTNKGSFKKGRCSLWKGKKLPKEWITKLSIAQTGKKGKLCSAWKGGKYKTTEGYILILKPTHPFHNKRGYVRRSRLVIEKQIGRYLKPKEVVHHKNEIKDDDRIENLMVFKNGSYHFWFHKKGFCNPKGIIFDGRKLLLSSLI